MLHKTGFQSGFVLVCAYHEYIRTAGYRNHMSAHMLMTWRGISWGKELQLVLLAKLCFNCMRVSPMRFWAGALMSARAARSSLE